jgi:hypothetical protein
MTTEMVARRSSRVIANEAKQSMREQQKYKSGLLRRGACRRARIRATRWLLAMTVNMDPRSRRAFRARFAHNFRPFKQRAWGMPGARRTRSLVCAWGSEYAHEYSQRVRRDHPASPRNGLRLMPRSPRRSGFLVTVAGENDSANLTPASRRQDHTSSPSAAMPFVIGTLASTASRPASVTIASRPSGGTGRRQ